MLEMKGDLYADKNCFLHCQQIPGQSQMTGLKLSKEVLQVVYYN
jgi:hypothetical protein